MLTSDEIDSAHAQTCSYYALVIIPLIFHSFQRQSFQYVIDFADRLCSYFLTFTVRRYHYTDCTSCAVFDPHFYIAKNKTW